MTELEKEARQMGITKLHYDKKCRLCGATERATLEHFDSPGTFICYQACRDKK